MPVLVPRLHSGSKEEGYVNINAHCHEVNKTKMKTDCC